MILDGPAVLGMADCRVLGRIVDASLLVVRSGAHQLMTLQRAKAMLEQSHVAIAGVVFNSLTEDMENWSSYGYDGAVGRALRRGLAAARTPTAEWKRAARRPWPWPDRPRPDGASPTRAGVIAREPAAEDPGASDRVICALIVVLVLGSALCFGGAVWWFRPVLAVAAFLLVARQADAAPGRRADADPEEPADAAGPAGAGPGRRPARPLARRPGAAASRRRPTRSIRAGFFADLVHADDPEASLPEPPRSARRRPSTARRPSAGWSERRPAWGSSGPSRTSPTAWGGSTWSGGCVVAGFLLNAALAIVQITNRSDGLYGLFLPGQRPRVGTVARRPAGDAATTALRTLGPAPPSGRRLPAAGPSRSSTLPGRSCSGR